MNKIAFEGLNLEFNINKVAISLGNKSVYWYGIIIACGFFLGWAYVMMSAKKEKFNTDHVFDIAIYGLIFGVIGARIYYVLFDRSVIEDGFWHIFCIWEGGIAIYGAIIGAVLSTYVYCKRKNLSVLYVFDLCVIGLMIGQMVGRWGNFFNVEVYGTETNLPWRMSINGGAGVHPLFLYESLWMFAGIVALHFYKAHKKFDGEIFFLYILWYGLGRVWIEGLRKTDYILYLVKDKVAVSQVVSVVCIVFGIAALTIGYRNAAKRHGVIDEKECETAEIAVEKDEGKNV